MPTRLLLPPAVLVRLQKALDASLSVLQEPPEPPPEAEEEGGGAEGALAMAAMAFKIHAVVHLPLVVLPAPSVAAGCLLSRKAHTPRSSVLLRLGTLSALNKVPRRPQ